MTSPRATRRDLDRGGERGERERGERAERDRHERSSSRDRSGYRHGRSRSRSRSRDHYRSRSRSRSRSPHRGRDGNPRRDHDYGQSSGNGSGSGGGNSNRGPYRRSRSRSPYRRPPSPRHASSSTASSSRFAPRSRFAELPSSSSSAAPSAAPSAAWTDRSLSSPAPSYASSSSSSTLSASFATRSAPSSSPDPRTTSTASVHGFNTNTHAANARTNGADAHGSITTTTTSTAKRAAASTILDLDTQARRKVTELSTHANEEHDAMLAGQVKPVFLTKQQRQELALQRMEEQRQKREAELRTMNVEFSLPNGSSSMNSIGHSAASSSSSSSLYAPSSSSSWRHPHINTPNALPPPPRDNLNLHINNKHPAPATSSLPLAADATPALDKERERELQLIKAQYMGQTLAKKKKLTSAQRHQITFDWDSKEDTSADPYALYTARPDVAPLFGRGFVGGVDRREQRKQWAQYEETVRQRLEETKHINPEVLRLNDGGVRTGAIVDSASSSGVSKVGGTHIADASLEDGELAAPIILSSAPTIDIRDKQRVAERSEREARRLHEAELMQRHWTEKQLEEMEERDWRILKEDFEIKISIRGARMINPMRFWHEMPFPPVIFETLKRVNYTEPTPIQRAAIPVGLTNQDLVGIAETGSGKTCAFVLPMLVYISKLPRLTTITSEAGPYALVLAPTRELAQQISEECDKFGAPMGIRNCSIVGGLSKEEQVQVLREGVEIVIATPGRLYDVIETRHLVLNQCNYIVLDEADRMIDMNFEPQITKIMNVMPSSNVRPENPDDEVASHHYRQTIMFSATMPPKVEQLTKQYLRHPVFITVGDRRGQASTNVEQRVEWVTSEQQKRTKLIHILNTERPPIIVFCNTKKTCDVVARIIEGASITCGVIHGNKSQEQREEALAAFKRGEVDVVVATDVMGRGIDVSGVQHVVNWELPDKIATYMHRIGRTGRAGQKGVATSFVTETDEGIFYDLREALQSSGYAVPSQLAHHEASKHKPGEFVPAARPKIQFAKR